MDDVFACWADDPYDRTQLRHLIENLVPRADLSAHRKDVARRWQEHDEAQARRYAEGRYRVAKATEDAIRHQSLIDRWFRRAA